MFRVCARDDGHLNGVTYARTIPSYKRLVNFHISTYINIVLFIVGTYPEGSTREGTS